VTLTITIFEEGAFHQSADFQLVNADTGRVQRSSSAKQVILDYDQWGGVLTYAGIGRLGGKETSSWLVDAFVSAGDGLSLDDATELIRERGTSWIARAGRLVPHTFTLAAFQRSEPVVAVISNFERAGRPRHGVESTLSTSWIRDPGGRAVLTGKGAESVATGDRALLQRVARRRSSRHRATRAVLAWVNRKAAGVDGSVSEACSCITLEVAGHGSGEHWGDPAHPFLPLHVTEGVCGSTIAYEQVVAQAESGEWPKGAAALRLGVPIGLRQFALSAGRARIDATHLDVSEFSPVREIPAAFVAEITRKRGRNEACWCGSGKKFKKCHGL
jgi:hypothetical protein